MGWDVGKIETRHRFHHVDISQIFPSSLYPGYGARSFAVCRGLSGLILEINSSRHGGKTSEMLTADLRVWYVFGVSVSCSLPVHPCARK